MATGLPATIFRRILLLAFFGALAAWLLVQIAHEEKQLQLAQDQMVNIGGEVLQRSEVPREEREAEMNIVQVRATAEEEVFAKDDHGMKVEPGGTVVEASTVLPTSSTGTTGSITTRPTSASTKTIASELTNISKTRVISEKSFVEDLVRLKGNKIMSDVMPSDVFLGGNVQKNNLTREVITVEQWITHIKRTHRKPNVLLILVDDMRPEIGGHVHPESPWLEPNIVTPNLDSLAAEGLLFRRAYCQIALSNPSRSSFLTSRRTDTTIVHNDTVNFRQRMPDVVTIPQYFRQNRYTSAGIGEVFHKTGVSVDNDDKHSWSKPMQSLEDPDILPDGNQIWEAVTETKQSGKMLVNEYVAKKAIELLEQLSEKRGPWFLAVGMNKPHLNWYFPERFLKHYADKNMTMPVADLASDKLPIFAWSKSLELMNNTQYANETSDWAYNATLPDWMVQDLKKAYYSAVTYVDDLIGKILSELKNLELADNTIVAFTSDHGYHLGEHNIIGESTVFEVANNVPLIIKVPGVTDNGMITDKLVELVDLFPTLADLTALKPIPTCRQGPEKSRLFRLCTDGVSVVPLFQNQSTDHWKDSVFFQQSHLNGNEHCMGHTVRTDSHRYTQWIHYDYEQPNKADWKKVCGVELYDLKTDPFERDNKAHDKQFEQLESELERKLKAGWKKAMQT